MAGRYTQGPNDICVLAFSEPPAHWGFRPSHKGNTWFIRISPERVPACLDALKARGINARALARDEEPGRPRNKKDRPRGKPARAAYDDARDVTQTVRRTQRFAQAVAQALMIENDKRRRAQAEATLMRREKQKQAQQRRQREALDRAAVIAAADLLKHPAGSA